MNVLVIPEDPQRDKDLLRPILKALFKELGFPRANVRICEKPRLRGVSEALKWERIETILDQYRGQTDLFLLIIDRDGEHRRRGQLDAIEERSQAVLRGDQALLGEHAIEEVEVWVLAGHDLPAEWKWRDVRVDRDPKERYFHRFLTEQRKLLDAASGRAMVAEEAARSIRRILKLCPDDFGRLANRIRERVT